MHTAGDSQGLTLLELTLWLAASGVFLAVIGSQLSSTSLMETKTQAWRNATDAGSTASHLLIEDLLRAGYAGEVSLGALGTTLHQPAGLKSSNLPNAVLRTADSASTVLSVRYANQESVSARLRSSNTLLSPQRLSADEFVLSSNLTAHIVSLESFVRGEDGGYLYSFVPALDAEAASEYRLHTLTQHHWYVRNTGRNVNGTRLHALYRYRNGRSAEMVTGVRMLELQHANEAVMLAMLLEGDVRASDADDTNTYQLLHHKLSASANASESVHDGSDRARFVLRTSFLRH